MTFINEVKMLLKKSNGNLAILNIDGGIKYELLNNNLSKILNKKIYDFCELKNFIRYKKYGGFCELKN